MTRRYLRLLSTLLFLFALSPNLALAVARQSRSDAPPPKPKSPALQQAVASAQSAGDNAWMLTFGGTGFCS